MIIKCKWRKKRCFILASFTNNKPSCVYFQPRPITQSVQCVSIKMILKIASPCKVQYLDNTQQWKRKASQGDRNLGWYLKTNCPRVLKLFLPKLTKYKKNNRIVIVFFLWGDLIWTDSCSYKAKTYSSPGLRVKLRLFSDLSGHVKGVYYIPNNWLNILLYISKSLQRSRRQCVAQTCLATWCQSSLSRGCVDFFP